MQSQTKTSMTSAAISARYVYIPNLVGRQMLRIDLDDDEDDFAEETSVSENKQIYSQESFDSEEEGDELHKTPSSGLSTPATTPPSSPMLGPLCALDKEFERRIGGSAQSSSRN